jgi:hypothetical protein
VRRPAEPSAGFTVAQGVFLKIARQVVPVGAALFLVSKKSTTQPTPIADLTSCLFWDYRVLRSSVRRSKSLAMRTPRSRQ